MKQFVVLMFVGLIGLLVGCSGEETRTVDWYLQPENKVAWEEKLKECNNNPGELNNIYGTYAVSTFVGKLSFNNVMPMPKLI